MTYEMILRLLQERKFDKLWQEGCLGAWEVTYAYSKGWMTDSELVMYSEMILNV